MKKILVLVPIMMVTFMTACGKDAVVTTSDDGFKPITTEEIVTEKIYTENIITEEIYTENIITEQTWEEMTTTWDDV